MTEPTSLRRVLAPLGRRLLARRLPSPRIGGLKLAHEVTARHGRPSAIDDATRLARPRVAVSGLTRSAQGRVARTRAPEPQAPLPRIPRVPRRERGGALGGCSTCRGRSSGWSPRRGRSRPRTPLRRRGTRPVSQSRARMSRRSRGSASRGARPTSRSRRPPVASRSRRRHLPRPRQLPRPRRPLRPRHLPSRLPRRARGQGRADSPGSLLCLRHRPRRLLRPRRPLRRSRNGRRQLPHQSRHHRPRPSPSPRRPSRRRRRARKAGANRLSRHSR